MRTMAELYRQVVEHSWLSTDGEMLRVTVSVGATLAVAGDTAESLVKRADELMYKSKLDGRNRVSSDL